MKEINIRQKSKALESLRAIKEKEFVTADIKLTNVNLRTINDNLGGINIFSKNDLYVLNGTLHAIMSNFDDDSVKQHHPHGLTPEALLEGLCNLQYSKEVCRSYDGRYEIISTTLFDKRVKAVIEKNAPLLEKRDAKINKLVTLYPTD